MLSARPITLGSWTFAVRDEAGEVARVRPPNTFTDGLLALGGVAFEVHVSGFTQGKVRLAFQGVKVASAEREAFSSKWRVRVDPDVAPAPPAFTVSRSFGGGTSWVKVGAETAGQVRRRGAFARRAEVGLPESWPLAVRAFVLLLALIDWRQGN